MNLWMEEDSISVFLQDDLAGGMSFVGPDVRNGAISLAEEALPGAGRRWLMKLLFVLGIEWLLEIYVICV